MKRLDNSMKSRKGNAYITVMFVTMALIMLVSTLLIVTANSRRTTSRYEHFVGLYDLAIAGNEYALHLLQQGLNFAKNDGLIIPTGDCELDFQNFITTAMPIATTNLTSGFSQVGIEHRRHWTFEIVYTMHDGFTIRDYYNAVTTVLVTGNSFAVSTRISKAIDDATSQLVPTVVNSRIVWIGCNTGESGNCLDYYGIEMIELIRISN